MTDPENNDEKAPRPARVWRRWVFWGVPTVGAAGAFAVGIIFWGGFNTAMEATNTMGFCISCHEMRDNVYQEYRHTIHYQNRSGVQATCSDCHVPDPWVHKVVRKIKATKELYGWATGKIDTPEKFEEHRLDLARNVWRTMKATDSRECRNCHTIESMAPEFQAPRARQQHLKAMETGQTCIDCHKGIAHKNVRDQLPDDELAALEAPDPRHIKDIPDSYYASLEYIQKVEAEAEAAEAEERRAEKAAIEARIAAAVEAERERLEAEQAGTAAAQGDDVAAAVDWSAVPAVTTTLFYPGQASFEWALNGRSHGGARPFTKGGEPCSVCHAKEVETIGDKIVAGGDLEPTPIPGKRGSIEADLQAAHDGENLYLRLQWQDGGKHNPAPFVEGGKMDPDHRVKVAMMIAGQGIEYVEQAGCWATCHSDNRYMADAPDAEALEAAGDITARLHAQDGVTKYIAESRTDIELRGRKRPLGGWDLPVPKDQIAAYLESGTYMDLLRAGSDGFSSNGHILDRRVEGEGPVKAKVTQQGGLWTAVLSRPLVSGAPGDLPIEPGQRYTVGFAIHDDHTAARFHHVTLDMTMALDDAEAALTVHGQ